MSPRLAKIVAALPPLNGLRVLEIGCGPGAMARELFRLVGEGQVYAIDRSPRAIDQAIRSSAAELRSGRLVYRQVAVEEFELDASEPLFDLAVAVRVGALDGRHPELEKQALTQLAKALKPGGRLYTDGGQPLREVPLPSARRKR